MSDGTEQHDDLQMLDERIEELMGMLDDLPEAPESSADDAADNAGADSSTPPPAPPPAVAIDADQPDPAVNGAPTVAPASEPAPDADVAAPTDPEAPPAPVSPVEAPPAPTADAARPPAPAESNGHVPDGPLDDQDITALLELTARELRGEVPRNQVHVHGYDESTASSVGSPAGASAEEPELRPDQRTVSQDGTPAPTADAQSIGELDQALAGRAAEALAADDADDLPSADDLAGAFPTDASDPDPVADEAATPDAAPAADDPSPSEAVPTEADVPAPAEAPAPAPAASPPSRDPEVVVAPDAPGRIRTLAQRSRLEPALQAAVVQIDGLMSGLEPRYRQTIKYVAIYIACNTVALWGYLLFRRPPPPPDPDADARVELRVEAAAPATTE